MLNLFTTEKLAKNYFFKNNFFGYRITSQPFFLSSGLFIDRIRDKGNFIIINKKFNCNAFSQIVRFCSSVPYRKSTVDLNELEHLSQIFFDRYSDRINMKTFYAKLQRSYITKIYFFDPSINFGGKTFFVKYSSLLLKNIHNQFFVNIWETAHTDVNRLIGLNLNSKIQNSFFKKWIFYFNSFFKNKNYFLVSFSRKAIKKKKKWKVYFKKRKKLLMFANYVKFFSSLDQVKYFRIFFNELYVVRSFFFEKQIILSDNLFSFFDNNFRVIFSFLNNFLSNYLIFEKYLLFFLSQKNLFFLFNNKGKHQSQVIGSKLNKITSLLSNKNLEVFYDSYKSTLTPNIRNGIKWFDFLNGKVEVMEKHTYFNNRYKEYNFFWKNKKKKVMNLLLLKSAFAPNRRFFWKSNISLFFSNFSFPEMRSLPFYISNFFSKIMPRGQKLRKESIKKEVNFLSRHNVSNFALNFFSNKFFYEKAKQKYNLSSFSHYLVTLKWYLGAVKNYNWRTFVFMNATLKKKSKSYTTKLQPIAGIVKKNLLISNFPSMKYFYLKKHNRGIIKQNFSIYGFSNQVLASNETNNKYFNKDILPVSRLHLLKKIKRKYFRKYYEVSGRVFTLFKKRFIKSKLYKPLVSFLGNLKKGWFLFYKNLKIVLMNFFCKNVNNKLSRFNFSIKVVYSYVLFISLFFFFKFNDFISFFNLVTTKMIEDFKRKDSSINKLFSTFNFIKKHLYFIVKKKKKFFNNVFSKAVSIIFSQKFSNRFFEKIHNYSVMIRSRIRSFLVSNKTIFFFNYGRSDTDFFGNITEKRIQSNLLTNISQLLEKNFNLGFLEKVPLSIFSRVSKYLKAFNYFFSKKSLEKRKLIKKKKKKQFRILQKKRFNKKIKTRASFLFKNKRNGIVLNKKQNILYEQNNIKRKNLKKKYLVVNKQVRKSSRLVRKKILRKYYKNFFKKLRKLRTLKKLKFKKLFVFLLKKKSLDWLVNLKKKKLNCFFSLKKKIYKKQYNARRLIKFRRKNKGRLSITQKYLKHLVMLNKLDFFSYYSDYMVVKTLRFRLRKQILFGLLKSNQSFLKVLGRSIQGHPKVSFLLSSIKQQMCRQTDSYSTIINKLVYFNNYLFYFVSKNRRLLLYVLKNFNLFFKVNPFFDKYVYFFKNVFLNSSFYSNLKNLKIYYKKKYLNLNLRKGLSKKNKKPKKLSGVFLNKLFNSQKFQVLKKTKKIHLQRSSYLKIVGRFLKKVRRRKSLPPLKKSIKKFVSYFNINLIFKLQKLNKRNVLRKKLKMLLSKRDIIKLVSRLVSVKNLCFGNILGILRLIRGFGFLGSTNNVINNFFEFCLATNKKNVSEKLFSEVNYFFDGNSELLFNDLLVKLIALDKNRIKIDWVVLKKIFLNFYFVVKEELSVKFNKSFDKEFNQKFELIFVFFLFNSLSFIFSTFLKKNSLNHPFITYDFCKSILLDDCITAKFFNYFSGISLLFLKNFPFYLVILNKKKVLIANTQEVNKSLSVFSYNKIISKLKEYTKLFFNKIGTNIENFKNDIKLKYEFSVENFVKKRSIKFFFLIVKAAKNNIFFTFLNRKGRLIKKGSGGMLGYEGPKRTTYLAATDNIKNVVSHIILKYKLRKRYNYKHKFIYRYLYTHKRKIKSKNEKKQQNFFSITKSFFFNVVAILRSSSKNMQIKAVLGGLYASGCKVIRILNYSARSHNGCRKKKVRRL